MSNFNAACRFRATKGSGISCLFPLSRPHLPSLLVARFNSDSAQPSRFRPAEALDFRDARQAFSSKSTLELLRAWIVFKTCTIGPLVRNCDKLYSTSLKVFGTGLVHGILRRTFFAHFCAGETISDIRPKLDQLRSLGVGGILDYAAEAKDDELPEVVHASDETTTVGAPLSSRMYDYKGEAVCDANAAIFQDAVRNVHLATPDGFAAIKLSGLGDPKFLERMSTCLVEMARLFERLGSTSQDVGKKKPYALIDRSVQLDYSTFSEAWKKLFNISDDELTKVFNDLDSDKDGKVTYSEWSKSVKLSEINALVRSCREQGPLYHAALNEEEIQLYHRMIARVESILSLAQELDVRVMIDAEWCDIQPAIDHIVLFLQRKFNRGPQPIVFNTYQTYLKGMRDKVQRDLDRSQREGWNFGAKVVRGAYMVSEREKAQHRGMESPVCETYEETEKQFHTVIDSVLERPSTEILVATHNRGSIERTVQKMKDLNVESNRVGFGQLLGMADHLTFTLGSNGYRAYKYVPYGPIGEVAPYLIRRTQENSSILGSPGVQEERAMLGAEVWRRLRPF